MLTENCQSTLDYSLPHDSLHEYFIIYNNMLWEDIKLYPIFVANMQLKLAGLDSVHEEDIYSVQFWPSKVIKEV